MRQPGMHEGPYTGNSALLRPPARISNPRWIYGPTTGTLPANWPMVIRKSPKRMKRPYNSTPNPMMDQRRRMRMIPDAKAAVPLSFWGRVKKTRVFWRPMIRVRPMRKRIYDCELKAHWWVRVPGSYVSHGKSETVSFSRFLGNLARIEYLQ